jgi:Spy/CpxP family protein refolding chaperone
MNRVRLLFIFGFVLSLCAGVVVGMVVRTAPPVLPRGGFGPDLGLSPAQEEQMRAIWAPVRESDRGRGDRRKAISKERDEAVSQLIPTEHRADYEKVLAEHTAKLAEMSREHEKLVQEAELKMKAMLTEQQWKQFEAMKRERSERRGGHQPSSRSSGHNATHPSDLGGGNKLEPTPVR